MARTKSAGQRLQRIVYFVFVSLLVAVFAFPFAFLFKLSLQPTRDALVIPIRFVPSRIILSNFVEINDVFPVLQQFVNSVVYSVCGAVLAVSTATLASYSLAKLRLPGGRLLVAFFIASVVFPPAMRAIPMYTTIAGMGLVDTWAGLILPFAATGFSIFFLYQYMIALPDSLLEQARIDGASEFRILWQIVLPLSSSAIGTIVLSTFIFRWRDYLWPLMVTKGTVTTLPIGLTGYAKGGEYIIQWNLIGAGSMYLFLPTLLLFLLMRRYIMRAFSLELK